MGSTRSRKATETIASNLAPNSARKSTQNMASTGKAPKLPSTPTKQGKTAASNTTPKLDQSAEKAPQPAKSATSNVQDSAQKAIGKSPKLPPRPKAGDSAKDSASKAVNDTKQKAEDASGDTKDQVREKITLEDNENEGDDEDTDVPARGHDTGNESTDFEKIDPEPIDDEEQSHDSGRNDSNSKNDPNPLKELQDALGGKANDTKNSVEATDGDVKDSAEDTVEKGKDGTDETADDTKATADDKVGKAKNTAEETADDTKATADNKVDEVKDTTEDKTGDATDQVKGTTEDAQGAVKDGQETAEDAVKDTEDVIKDTTDNLPDLSTLKDLEVNEDGNVLDKEGNAVGKLVEGEASDLVGRTVGDNGEILDEDEDLIGRVVTIAQETKDEVDEAKDDVEDQVEEAEETYLPEISVLNGLEVGENGDIFDKEGILVGRINEGEPDDLIGQTLNEEGEVLDEDGDAIGRAEVLPQPVKKEADDVKEEVGGGVKDAAEEAEIYVPDIGVLEGLRVEESGEVKNAEGEVVGKITEGNPEDFAGQKLNEKGEVLDEEGDVIGRAKALPQQAEEEITKITPDATIFEGKKVNKKGKILDDEGDVIGQLTEDSDTKQCIGKIPNEKGEILNDKGEIVGKVEVVEGDAAEEAMKAAHPELLEQFEQNAEKTEEAADKVDEATDKVQDAVDQLLDISELEGLKVNKNGEVLNEDGDPIARLSEGELADVKGKKLNNKGEILDKDGNVIGKVELIKPSEDQAAEDGENVEQVEHTIIKKISILEGLKCNKTGFVVDKDGNPVGKLVEGDAKKISKLGAEADKDGKFWDSKGNVIGRAETIAQENEEEGTFAGLEGLKVVDGGFVEDDNGNKVGKLVEGDEKKMVGRHVDEDGDVIDRKGNVVGHAERYEEPEEEVQEEEKPDLSILKGLKVNKQGNVIGNDGVPIARLVKGNIKELAGKKVDENGQIWNDSGKVVGRVELIPEGEREDKPEGIFGGLEGLVVRKDGFVYDEEGNKVGQVTDGDPKKLAGRSVDEDGDIIDKYGNIKGHAEPYGEEEEEEADLSSLDGKVVNKAGNVVDAQGIVFGRIASGDPSKLAGRKVDGKGQIWDDSGKVIGRAELIPGGDRSVNAKEGPFSAFENLTIDKEGMVKDQGGNIVGRVVEGDPKNLQGRRVDTDGDILDKSGNSLGRAERWTPEEKKRNVNPMSGHKVNKEGDIRDADGNLLGKVTSGNLPSLIGKEIDDNGYIVDNDGNKIGEATLLENLPEEEKEVEEGPTEEELSEQRKGEENAEIARRIIRVLHDTLDRVEPVCKQITDVSHSLLFTH